MGTNHQVLFDAMSPGLDDQPLWNPRDLNEIFRHQIDSPLAYDLGRLQAGSGLLKKLSNLHPEVNTFGELLEHSTPPLEMLRLVKEFAKVSRTDPESPVPSEVATVLYFAAIGAAIVKHRERISSSDVEVIVAGLVWSLAQDWLNDTSVRAILSDALGMLRADGTL